MDYIQRQHAAERSAPRRFLYLRTEKVSVSAGALRDRRHPWRSRPHEIRRAKARKRPVQLRDEGGVDRVLVQHHHLGADGALLLPVRDPVR